MQDDVRVLGKEITSASGSIYRWDLATRPPKASFLMLCNVPQARVLLCTAKVLLAPNLQK
jgi:hypothetical protein